MGDRLLGISSWYVSQLRQLSLLSAIGRELNTGQGTVAVLLLIGWEGNRRSGVALSYVTGSVVVGCVAQW